MERLVFGTGPIARSDTRQRHRRAFARHLSEALGLEVVVVVASTYEELSGLVDRGEAQLAWLPPAVFVRAHDRGEIDLLCTAVRAQGSRFRGSLYVREDTPWHDPVDLAGLRIAWVDRGSCSGYLFPRLALIERGIEPDTFFGRQFLLGSHNAVARAVSVGKADVGATFIDSTDSGAQRPGWTLELDESAMRPVLVTGFIPADAIGASPDVSEAMRDRIGSVLCSMHDGSETMATLLGLFGIDRFERGRIDDYEPVRRAIATVRIRQ